MNLRIYLNGALEANLSKIRFQGHIYRRDVMLQKTSHLQSTNQERTKPYCSGWFTCKKHKLILFITNLGLSYIPDKSIVQ